MPLRHVNPQASRRKRRGYHHGGVMAALRDICRQKAQECFLNKCSVSYCKRRKYHLQGWINLNTYKEADLLISVEIYVRWVPAPASPRIGFATRLTRHKRLTQRKDMTAALCLVTTPPCHTIDAYKRPDVTGKTFERCIPIVSVLNSAFSSLFSAKRAPQSIGATSPW